MKRIFILAGLLWALAASTVQADVFDPATNVLTIPSLQIGTSAYENTRLLLSPGGQWSVLSLGTARATTTDSGSGATTTASTLKVSPSSMEVYVGEEIGLSAGGGTPPYSFVASRSILAQTYKSGGTAKFATYGVGAATITVTDAAGAQATCTVTIKSGLWTGSGGATAGSSPLTGVVGEQITIHFGNGVPPYRVGTSNSAIAKAGEVTYHAPLQGSATIYTYRAGTVTIMVHDDYGNMVSTTLTVSASR